MKDAREIILRPILTEKSVAQTRQRRYTFAVAPAANKVEIRQAVERLFPGTRVASVHTITVHGKRRRLGGYRRRAARTTAMPSA